MSEDLGPQAHWIHGIGIGGYRSFGPVQKFGPFRKVNLIIGQNNSGKSNLLRFLWEHYGQTIESLRHRQQYTAFKDLDRNRDSPAANFQLWIGLPVEGRQFDDLRTALHSQGRPGRREDSRVIAKLLTGLGQGCGVAWIAFENSPGSGFDLTEDFVSEILDRGYLHEEEWGRLHGKVTNYSGGQLRTWVARTISIIASLSAALTSPPAVVILPAIRQVVPSDDEEEWNWGGCGLILRLLRLRDPGHTPEEQESKKKFEAVNTFLRSVTGEKSATLEIPHTRDTINVRMNGRILPLESLGTGVHEVVIIAAAATVHSKQVICIEEPEIHLHPILQRKLLQYLEEETDNQYFFATHSAHLLQHPNAAIFHVRLENGQSVVSSVSSPREKSEVCVDLGYRAADILQANCVIWVEGPSDRLYLRHWIQAVASGLVEGVHYSIMFYGGRLLNHLTANDPEIEDFISLRRLNRFIMVVMDSDRGRMRQRLTDTKQRVRKEFDGDPERGFAWVTQGREIENYLPASVLENAIRTCHRNVHEIAKHGRYERLLRYRISKRRGWKDADKVKVARQAISVEADLDQLDLRKQVERVLHFIRQANEY